LLRAAFGRWQAPPLRFEQQALEALAAAVQAVTQCIPHLLIGAVELHEGDFIAFSSERSANDGGVSMDAEIGGRPVRIEGRSELADDMDSGSQWRVQAVRITAVAPRRPAPGRQPAADAALAGERAQAVPASPSRH